MLSSLSKDQESFYHRLKAMKHKQGCTTLVQDLCRRLKLQLDELAIVEEVDPAPAIEEKNRRLKMMEQLKEQLAELSR